MTRYYSASDYAGIKAGDFEFYYGYEYGYSDDDDGGEIWGFRAKKRDKVIFEYAQRPEMYNWDPVAGLMDGIAKCFDEGIIK